MASRARTARAASAAAEDPIQGPHPRVFVGRKAALAKLAALATRAHGGRGEFALLCGAAGVGKTSLLEQLATRFGGLAAQATSHPADDGPAYAPWRSIVGTLLDRADDAALAPGLRAELEIFAAGGATEGIGEGNPGAASFALSRAIGNLVRACGPTLIALDDHHWADPASRHLLERLPASIGNLPVLLVVALRDGEVEPKTLARLLRLATLIHLEPFSATEAQSLLDACGEPPDRLERLMDASAGNPLLLTDMIAAGTSESLDVSLAGRFFLNERMAALGPETLEALHVLALIGRPLALDQLAGHLGQTRARVAELVERAVRAAVLRTDPLDPSRLDFIHDIYREAVLRDLPAVAREHAHLRIARELGADGDIARGSAAELARHLLAAGELANRARVSLWCQRAGRESMAFGDSLRAVEWFEAALRADGGRPSGRSADSPQDRLLDLARAHVRAGNRPRAEETYAQLIVGARAAGDARLLSRAVLGLANPPTSSQNPKMELIALLEEALRAIGPDDLALHAGLSARLASATYFQRDLAACRELSATAVEEARRTGDRSLLLMTLLARRFVLWGPDELDVQDALLAEMLALVSEGIGDSRDRQMVYIWGAQHGLVQGSRNQFEITLARWRAEVERTNAPGLLASLQLVEGTCALMDGRLDAAEAAVAAVTREFTDLEDPDLENRRQYCLVQLFRVARERGDLASLETGVRALVEEYPGIAIWRAGLAMLLADEGRTQDGVAEIERLRRRGFVQIPRDGNWLPALAALAEAAATLEHRAAARELLDLLEPLPARRVVVATGIDCWGSLNRFRGLLHEVLDQRDAAEASFEAALSDDERAGNLLAAAYDQLGLARLQRPGTGPGSGRRAARLLAKARKFALARGLSRLLGLIEAATAEPSAAQRPEARAAPAQRTAIFRREGTSWRIGWEDTILNLPATLGMAAIHRLLQRPGEAIPAIELNQNEAAAITTSILRDLRVMDGAGPPTLLLDRRARDEIRARLEDVETEISTADESGDLGRAESLGAERDSILETLEQSLDHRHRSRSFVSEAERARINVTRTIRSAIGRLRQVVPALGEHLDRLITTGRMCSYTPDPLAPLDIVLH